MTPDQILFARRAAFWHEQSKRFKPRNAGAIETARKAGQLGEGDNIVVSFVDRTPLRFPHVFVDPGRAYDWRFASLLGIWVAVKPGIDTRQVMGDLFDMSLGHMGLIDVERQIVADVAAGAKGLKLYPERRGSDRWQAVFG